MYVLLCWILNALVLWLISFLVPGVQFASTWSLFITVIVFGLVNALIRPLLIILTLPLNVLTLGLLTFVINALMFWLTSSIVKGFEVADFWSAFWGAFIYWIFVMIMSYIDNKPVTVKAKATRRKK